MSGSRVPVGPAGSHAQTETITISFAGYNRAWAAWIGYVLERHGQRVVYQRWEGPSEVPLAEQLRDLKLAPGRILIVVSEWYFQLGPRTYEEWNTALREVVAPEAERFAGVLVTTQPVPTATTVLAAPELGAVGAEEAERRVLDRLDLLGRPLVESVGSARQAPRFPTATPEVWDPTVPRRNTRFTGREKLLNDAYRLLQDAQPGAGVVAFHGMPGVGKTQLVAEFVYRFRLEYDVVWWVRAEKRSGYRRALAELAPKLGLITGADYGERLRAVRNSLRRGDPYANWLLVLDGADEPEEISDLVPTGTGHVLITSRNPQWRDHNSQLLEVPVYDRTESVAFIRRRAPRLTWAEAEQLAEALEDLPLALDQTAGWLNDSDMSVTQYLDLLEGSIDRSEVKVSPDFRMSFQQSWSILLGKLRETAPESVDLVQLCTFFAPGLIPVDILRQMPTVHVPDRIAELLDDSDTWQKAVKQLRRYSVIPEEFQTADPDENSTSGGLFYLHRMVHQIVRQNMPDQDRQELIDVVRQALVAANPGNPDDVHSWDKYAQLVPHLKYADVLRSEERGVQRLVLDSLRYMYQSGDYVAGIKLGERAMDAWRSLLGENHPKVWEVAHHYANLLRGKGEYQRSEAITRSAIKYLREAQGAESLAHIRAVSGLAADLRALAQYEESLALSEWLILTCRAALSADSVTTLSVQNNLAVTLRLLGRYEQARECDRRTLEERRRILPPGNPATLSSEFHHAMDLRLLGQYNVAGSIQRENVRELRKAVGPGNYVTLLAEYNHALCVYGNSGRDRERMNQLLATLADLRERSERVLGETSPFTLIVTSGYGCFARQHGDIDEARAVSESVIARYEAMLPAEHPYIAGSRANYALILSDVGEREQAHAMTAQALLDMTTAVGQDHPWTLGCALNASAMRQLVGDFDAAAELSKDTVTKATGTLGRAHPLTVFARIGLADDMRGLRSNQQAEKVEQEALSDLTSVFGAQHSYTVQARRRERLLWDFEPQET
ncbi:FxSxx-COOH system tetratricopeptide repeat protein [Streptomyces sp. LRE541]|uniref:FxSxx-COOH system tetratricopeptide repeat protein n=1 Tax=Streptomyces sp. LRE541 TaxID=2931983 RepID=UPI00200DC172|nr:FxSxx-COOH system tetratricopeptide repeat protein [Streptomyces sp. LRE541]UPZ28984.1 FxSxx-COOH system tetratricopeptide repeat protein [Streptomyces sp. LRE541]